MEQVVPDLEVAPAVPACAGTPAAVLVLDRAATVRFWSPAAQTVFGYRADQVIGREVDLLLPTDAAGRGGRSLPLRTALHEGGGWQGGLPVRLASGAALAAWFDCTPLTGPDGEDWLLCQFRSEPATNAAELRVRQRIQLLHTAGATIGSSLETGRTARELAEVTVPDFADLAVVEVLGTVLEDEESAAGDSRLARRLAVASAPGTPTASGVFREAARVRHPPGSLPHELARTASPWLAHPLDPAAELALTGGDAEQVSRLRASGLTSLLVVPLVARSLVLGLVYFGRTGERPPLDHEDLALAEELAARAALCLDNARLYTRERNTAVTLQRSMLPRITEPECARVAHRYRPGDQSAQVGGDWFDVVDLGSGRVGLVIGDVMGHGVPAAAAMGQLRGMVHALAKADLDPRRVLALADDVVLSHQDTQYATCLYAVVDTGTGQGVLANAGHPPPLVLAPGGACRTLEVGSGIPLGVGGVDFEVSGFTVQPGDTLVLYTDGLVERRELGVEAGIAALRQTLGRQWADLEQLCDGVLAQLGPDPTEDDVALLAVRFGADPAQSPPPTVAGTVNLDPSPGPAYCR